jgi:hypothetical protein
LTTLQINIPSVKFPNNTKKMRSNQEIPDCFA